MCREQLRRAPTVAPKHNHRIPLMKKYNIVNNLTGWLCFIVAAVTYLLTVEPTALRRCTAMETPIT